MHQHFHQLDALERSDVHLLLQLSGSTTDPVDAPVAEARFVQPARQVLLAQVVLLQQWALLVLILVLIVRQVYDLLQFALQLIELLNQIFLIFSARLNPDPSGLNL